MKTVLKTFILCLVLVTMASVSNVVGQTDALDPKSLGLTRRQPDPDWIAQQDTLRTFWMSVPRYSSIVDLAPVVDLTPSSQMDRAAAYLSSFPIDPFITGGLYGNVSYPTNLSTMSLTSGYYQGASLVSPQWLSTPTVNIVTTPTSTHGYIGSFGSLGLSFFSNTPSTPYQLYSGTGGHYIVKYYSQTPALFGIDYRKLPWIPDPIGPLPIGRPY